MKCVKCGETKEAIKKHKLVCGEVSYEGELQAEFGRHRFTPYSSKEKAAMQREEERYLNHMQGFADFVTREEITHNKPN